MHFEPKTKRGFLLYVFRSYLEYYYYYYYYYYYCYVGLDIAKNLLFKISLVDITPCHLAITGDLEECSASILKSSPRRLS
jgi:hypothetical protein